eukprot:7354499-Pyramimonas_sp.AAC.1
MSVQAFPFTAGRATLKGNRPMGLHSWQSSGGVGKKGTSSLQCHLPPPRHSCHAAPASPIIPPPHSPLLRPPPSPPYSSHFFLLLVLLLILPLIL